MTKIFHFNSIFGEAPFSAAPLTIPMCPNNSNKVLHVDMLGMDNFKTPQDGITSSDPIFYMTRVLNLALVGILNNKIYRDKYFVIVQCFKEIPFIAK